MSYSPALKWFVLPLLALLALTLGLKLAWHTTGYTSAPNEKNAQLKVAEFLVRQHFTVAVSAEAKEGEPTVRATAPACRMLIVKSPTLGWDSNMVRRYATDADRVLVVFRGRVYGDPPTWLIVSDYLWSRLRRRLGLKFQTMPVFTVIATMSCDAERLPWNQLE